MPVSISILFFGFLLGIRHATDADHVVAITTITAKQKHIKGSALIGILWGIGHSITVTLIGIPIIFFSLKIPTKIGLALEFSVGVMLVVLGVINLYSFLSNQLVKAFKTYCWSPSRTSRLVPTCRDFARRIKSLKAISSIIHKHAHSHFNIKEHSHFHMHHKGNANDKKHHLSFFQIIRPVFIGLVHGLAGSSAIAILILSTINNNILAIFYLVIFHVGVIIGMMIITTLLAASIKAANQKLTFLHKYLAIGSGILSLVFGLSIIYKIGFVDGLFMLY